MGMSHASIITLLKHGFHRHKIPWGFNADHQPVGGRFDAIEKELVAGSVFASYITFDLSPELSLHELLDDEVMLETAFASRVDAGVFGSVVKRLAGLGFGLSTGYIKKIVTFLMPAMNKMKRRDERYKEIRRTVFSTNEGRRFLRELSVDELPGETAPETLAVILALTEALGVTFDFIAPNIGFQKNIPYPDNAALRKKIKALYAVAGAFDMSIGFHSGSGKSFENYGIIGQETEKRFEVKTSGRYTYEMGVALSKSANPKYKNLGRLVRVYQRLGRYERIFRKCHAEKFCAGLHQPVPRNAGSGTRRRPLCFGEIASQNARFPCTVARPRVLVRI